MGRGAWGATVHDIAKSQTWQRLDNLNNQQQSHCGDCKDGLLQVPAASPTATEPQQKEYFPSSASQITKDSTECPSLGHMPMPEIIREEDMKTLQCQVWIMCPLLWPSEESAHLNHMN